MNQKGCVFPYKKFDGYGKLSQQSIDELQIGARIEVGEKKAGCP